MVEIWKDIEGYEGLYQVSNLGKVKSLERTTIRKNGIPIHVKERILKYCATGYEGYWCVHLFKGTKSHTHLVHRLVGKAFLPNPNNLPQINHLNENKDDNRVCNLEWCTQEHNMNWGTCAQRGGEKRGKMVMCVETGIVYPSMHEAMRQTGVDNTSIGKCCRENYRVAGGYHWKYVS